MLQERKDTILGESGKFLIDIAKLVFGGVILSGIMKGDNMDKLLLFLIGGIVVLLCFISGMLLMALSKRKEK